MPRKNVFGISPGYYRVLKSREQNRLGRANEDRTWAVLSRLMGSMEKPEWLKSVRRATFSEDRYLATDFVIETNDIGPIFLNVKSSEWYADRFNNKRRSRRVVAVIMDAVLAADEYAAEDFILDVLWGEYKSIRTLRGDEI
ncbi:MAG: hypothetical protein WCO48_02145 [Candidatus Taylorbacteria bacterium]